MQAFAISVVPLGELERAAGTGRRRGAAFVKELLRWFKTDFFKWTNNPACAACGSGQTTCCGMAQPTMEEQSCLAGRVEIYECGSCGAQTRFPRYNSAVKLLETRNGRCGEWANCFTLICRALGLAARLANDWTDHVWTEVYLAAEPDGSLAGGWRHCDPCENRFDAPLMYEQGWGKQLNWVVATGVADVTDVTARYTAAWAAVLPRRSAIQEPWLRATLAAAHAQQR
eukprot:COSAG01_NODE_2822_length_7009_cov_3.862663_6_plen_228_part_00